MILLLLSYLNYFVFGKIEGIGLFKKHLKYFFFKDFIIQGSLEIFYGCFN